MKSKRNKEDRPDTEKRRRIHNAPVRDSRVCTHCGEPIDDRTNRIGCGRQKCTQWRYRQRLKARRHKVTCHEIKAEQGGPPRHRETPPNP
jgi:hypothetical protein